jgi:hypothetical protein
MEWNARPEYWTGITSVSRGYLRGTLSQASCEGRKWRGGSGGVDCRGTSGFDFVFHGGERSQPLVSELWSLLWYSVIGGTD